MCEAQKQGRVCATCRQAEEAEQQYKETAQPEGEQEPDHALAQQHQEMAPQVKEQGENPQAKVRSSSRVTKRPSHLMYSRDFNQHETRETTPDPKPQKPGHQDEEGSGTEV